MCILSNLSSAEEQSPPAESRRNTKPEHANGKFQGLTSVLGGAIALGAVALSGGSANAGSFTPPGDTVGLAIGAPLPEGVYFVDILSDGGYRGVDDKKSDLLFNIPAIAWSTPWTIFGGRVWGYGTAPELSAGFPFCPATACGPVTGGSQGVPPPLGGRDYTFMYNPLGVAGLAWDLGGSWGFSDVAGGYSPVDNELRIFGHDIWVFSNRAAISYTGDKWNLTAEVVTGLTGDDLQTHQRVQPNYLNLNLTAVKTLGKWEAGAIAFYSTDLENFTYGPVGMPLGECPRGVLKCEQSQFAAGGELGYDFPGFTALLQATSDVWTDNYRNIDGTKSYETRVWFKAIIPLWIAPKEEAPMK